MLPKWPRRIFLFVLITCFNILCLGLLQKVFPDSTLWSATVFVMVLAINAVAWFEFD